MAKYSYLVSAIGQTREAGVTTCPLLNKTALSITPGLAASELLTGQIIFVYRIFTTETDRALYASVGYRVRARRSHSPTLRPPYGGHGP